MKAIHHKIKDIKCDQCSYVTVNILNLKYHGDHIHQEGKVLPFEECASTAWHRSLLAKHEEEEHGILDSDGNYHCKHCEYKCPNRLRLERHMKCVHLQIRDFKCDLCNFTCALAHNLKGHMKTSHGHVYAKKSKIKKHVDVKVTNYVYLCRTFAPILLL